MTAVHADIDALKGLHEALVRFRYAQREVADRGGDQIELTRASLADKASHWQARLEHIRHWQQRVEVEADEFRGAASVFGDLLDNGLPRAESQLLALIRSLEAARRVQASGS